MQVISIFSQKGGVGKTTTTVNLASALQKEGFKVLVVDIDPQGNASASLGIATWELEKQVKDILLGNADINDCLITVSDGLKIIPSNILLADQEIPISGQPGRELLLRKSLRKLKDKFDYVLIDCPPSVGVFSINALLASNYVLIPVDMSFLGLMGVKSIERTLKLIQDSLEHNIQIIGVLATQFDVRNNLTKEVHQELKNHFEEKLFKTVIPLNVRLKEAPSFGKSIIDYDPSSAGALSYEELAREVIERCKV
jgi:chromosome partitioning protein